jgi:hypothetical protein
MLGEDVVFEPAAIPAVVFTDPELAWAGLTETEAQKLGRKVEIAKFPWAASGRALTLDRTDGLTKLVIEPGAERVLGVGIVGPGAGEMIAEGTLAIEMGAVAKDQPSRPRHTHIVGNGDESAEMFFGHATRVCRPKDAELPCCRAEVLLCYARTAALQHCAPFLGIFRRCLHPPHRRIRRSGQSVSRRRPGEVGCGNRRASRNGARRSRRRCRCRRGRSPRGCPRCRPSSSRPGSFAFTCSVTSANTRPAPIDRRRSPDMPSRSP